MIHVSGPLRQSGDFEWAGHQFGASRGECAWPVQGRAARAGSDRAAGQLMVRDLARDPGSCAAACGGHLDCFHCGACTRRPPGGSYRSAARRAEKLPEQAATRALLVLVAVTALRARDARQHLLYMHTAASVGCLSTSATGSARAHPGSPLVSPSRSRTLYPRGYVLAKLRRETAVGKTRRSGRVLSCRLLDQPLGSCSRRAVSSDAG